MGLLITLYLIMINTHASVEAPSGRGISYVETWYFGCQAPIAFAIMEYGIILCLRKMSYGMTKSQEKRIDYGSFICSFSYFLIFNGLFWGHIIINFK